MTSTDRLTSLAMLKVNIDQGKDYLDYLRPFILQVLVDHNPDPISDGVVRDHLLAQFGLQIPERAVQVVLKRLARKYHLKKESGVYRITEPLPNPGIAEEKVKAERRIEAVVSGLMEFSKSTGKQISSRDEAVAAVCTFLSKFNIPCLRAYLRGTALPTMEDIQDFHIILVSDYVIHLQRTDSEGLDSFIIVVQGHMLANALTCPDLSKAPKTFKGVTFYLDTPLLIRQLGLEGTSRQAATEMLIGLLHSLGATVATFSHSREELERVLKGAANHVNGSDGRGAIVTEARRSGITKSDLLLLAGKIDEKLGEAQIQTKDSPPYVDKFQIDEEAFEKVLDDEVSYFNPRAREYDINSVRSIYSLRAGISPLCIENSRALLVSSNVCFAQAAFEYGQLHQESRDVSSVITDFSLANVAWLKAPMGAPTLPITEVLAFSYAALQPPRDLLSKYLSEIDKLEKQGKITERDHQLLRSSGLAQEELMRLTLGDDAALTQETVVETLYRVSSEIKKEEAQKLAEEVIRHDETREQLARVSAEKKKLRQHTYWRCRRLARIYTWVLTGIVAIFLVAGMVTGFDIRTEQPAVGWVFLIGGGFMTSLSLFNVLVGTTVKQFHQSVQAKILTHLLHKEARTLGIDLGAIE